MFHLYSPEKNVAGIKSPQSGSVSHEVPPLYKLIPGPVEKESLYLSVFRKSLDSPIDVRFWCLPIVFNALNL